MQSEFDVDLAYHIKNKLARIRQFDKKGKIGLHVQTTSWRDMKINLAELI